MQLTVIWMFYIYNWLFLTYVNYTESFCILTLLSFIKVEGCSSGESSLSLELNQRKRLSAEEERCASRPPPEGAGAVSLSESDREETKPDLCKQCQMTTAELRRQVLALSDPASFKVSEREALFQCLCKSNKHIQDRRVQLLCYL